MTYKARIKEIFPSVQGEGPFVGYKQLFIRFCGCNLACSYCDTDFRTVDSVEYSVEDLVEIVKNFTTEEKEFLENVMIVRCEYINAHTNKEKLVINAQLSSYLKSLYLILEKNPMLKSNVQLLKLQDSLTEIEEDIVYARQFYNDSVTIYNNKLMYFPNNIVASLFNFKEEELFDAVKDVEVSPRIRFKEIHKCPICGAVITKNSTNCEYCGGIL